MDRSELDDLQMVVCCLRRKGSRGRAGAANAPTAAVGGATMLCDDVRLWFIRVVEHYMFVGCSRMERL